MDVFVPVYLPFLLVLWLFIILYILNFLLVLNNLLRLQVNKIEHIY